MKKYVIFDYIHEGYVSAVRKNAYSTSRLCCDALLFPSREIAQSFVYILERLFCDVSFSVTIYGL